MLINVFSSILDPKGYNYCIVHIVKVIIFGTLDILFLQFELSKSPPSKEPSPLQKNKQNEQHGMYLEANQLLVAILFPSSPSSSSMISYRSVDRFHPDCVGRIHDHPTLSVHQGYRNFSVKNCFSIDGCFDAHRSTHHQITLMFLLIGIPLNNLVTITCFPPLAAGGAACVSFATVVGEAAAGTDGGLSDAATFELSVATTES